MTTVSSSLNLGIYLSPRVISASFRGLKRHMTLTPHSAASTMAAGDDSNRLQTGPTAAAAGRWRLGTSVLVPGSTDVTRSLPLSSLRELRVRGYLSDAQRALHPNRTSLASHGCAMIGLDPPEVRTEVAGARASLCGSDVPLTGGGAGSGDAVRFADAEPGEDAQRAAAE